MLKEILLCCLCILQELILGVAYVFALMPAYFYAMDCIDTFILQNPISPYVCFCLGLFLCLTYPAGDTWSPARMDTYIIVACGTGISLGYYVSFTMGWIYVAPGSAPYEIIYPDVSRIGIMILRTVIGVVLLVLTRAVCKKLSYETSCYFFNRDKNDPATKYELCVELPCKFFTYSCVAFNAVTLVPYVFRLLNIERESSFTEA